MRQLLAEKVSGNLVGLWLMQSAFSAGPLHTSLPGITATEPVVGIVLGLVIFRDSLHISPEALALETLRAVVDAPFLEASQKVEALYLAALTRKPEPRELEKMLSHVVGQAGKDERRQAYTDIYWALLNSPEFVLSR